MLGAYGAVGLRVLVEAATRGHLVTAVGRDATRLAAVTADARRQASVTDATAIRELAAENDVVVNATGAELVDLAVEVTDAGAAFVEISAEPRYLQRLGLLQARQRAILAGTGLAPGLTNILAAAVPGAEPIRIGIVAGVGERHGNAAREWIWGGAGTLADVADPSSRIYRSSARFDIPGLGRRTLLRAAFGEQGQLSASAGRDVSSWLALDPAFSTWFLRLAGIVPNMGRYLDLVSGPLAFLSSRDTWTVVVTDGDRTLGWARGRNQTVATGIMTALSLRAVADAAPGVYAAHELMTIGELREELTAAGITVSTPA